MTVQTGCSGCQQGMGIAMPDVTGSIKGWFEQGGMDWRLGIGALVLGVVALMYIGVPGSMEE